MTPVFIAYLTGLVIGLVGSDAPPRTRVTLAALWPVGLAAFVVTVAILIAASLVAFPIIGLIVAALAAGLAAWMAI